MVMFGHALQYLSGDGFKDNIPFNVIYSFHMPLFMIVSGYFFSSSLKLDPIIFLMKKSIALILPAFVWCVIKVVLNRGGQMTNILIDSFWFLKSAFLCYLICYIAVRLIRKELVAYIVLVIASVLFYFHSEPFMLNYMLPSFIVGILLRHNSEWIMHNRKYILPCTIIVYLCLIPFWKFEYFLGRTPFEGTEILQQISITAYRQLIGVAGSLSIILVFSYLNKSFDIITFIGSSTLSFYVMNGLFSDIQRHILHIEFSNQLLCLAAASLLVAIQIPIFYWFTKLFRKYRVTRLLLLGINK